MYAGFRVYTVELTASRHLATMRWQIISQAAAICPRAAPVSRASQSRAVMPSTAPVPRTPASLPTPKAYVMVSSLSLSLSSSKSCRDIPTHAISKHKAGLQKLWKLSLAVNFYIKLLYEQFFSRNFLPLDSEDTKETSCAAAKMKIASPHHQLHDSPHSPC